MKLKIVQDVRYDRTYDLFNDKQLLAVILEDLDGSKELSFTIKRLKINELREVYEFVSSYDKWLTESEV